MEGFNCLKDKHNTSVIYVVYWQDQRDNSWFVSNHNRLMGDLTHHSVEHQAVKTSFLVVLMVHSDIVRLMFSMVDVLWLVDILSILSPFLSVRSSFLLVKRLDPTKRSAFDCTLRPAAVSPRNSRCFITGLQILSDDGPGKHTGLHGSNTSRFFTVQRIFRSSGWTWWT